MSIRLRVRRKRQIVVPVRFVRAVSGPTQPDAPDVDDRGFAMGTRPGTWGATEARGAMVSIQEGDTIRVKVLHEDIDDSAPLFVTSTNPAMAAIAGPAGPLVGGVFQLEGVKDSKNQPVKIQCHLGDAAGPVLGELEPHIFQLRQLRVRAHLVSINPPGGVRTADSTTSRTAASLVTLFQDVNKIWRAAGIEFLYVAAETRSPDISGLAVRGQVTTHLNATPPTFAEFSQVINFTDAAHGQSPDPNAINVYFVRQAVEWLGLTFDHDAPRPTGFGIVIPDFHVPTGITSVANDLAHELGHYLDSDVHAGDNSAGTHIRDDIASERRLMFNFNPLNAAQDPPYRRDVGYNTARGALITVKKLDPDPSDGEIARNRRRALNPN